MFSLKTLAAATAAAVGLAAVTTTPAQAENGDIARFLVGAAAVAIIADAANNRHRNRVEKQYVYVPAQPPRHRHREVIVVRPIDRHDHWDHRRDDRRADRWDHRRDRWWEERRAEQRWNRHDYYGR